MSNLKYKVGNRVRIKNLDWYNKNKSKSHRIVECGGKYFIYDMREWCGKIMTILETYQTCYIMEEDGAKYLWTDEMIEGLVEEETKPKFKVGDKIKLKSTLVTDIFSVIGYESEGYRITNISNGLTYLMSYRIEPYYELMEKEVDFEKMYMESEKRYEEEYSKGEYCHKQSFKWGFQEGYDYAHENEKLEINLKTGYEFKDENGNVINAKKIVLEKKSPKTNDIIKWLRECDMTKYIGVIYSGMCSITFDTEGLITDFLKTVEDDE